MKAAAVATILDVNTEREKTGERVASLFTDIEAEEEIAITLF